MTNILGIYINKYIYSKINLVIEECLNFLGSSGKLRVKKIKLGNYVFFPTPPRNSPVPAGYPTIQLISDTHWSSCQIPQVKGSVLQECPP